MTDFLLGVFLTALTLSIVALYKMVSNTRRALYKLMQLMEEKWRAEATFAQQRLDAIVDNTIEKIRRDSDDLD
jgi:type II secretory pathway component PulJ